MPISERVLGNTPDNFGDSFLTALNMSTQNTMAMQQQKQREAAAQQAALMQNQANLASQEQAQRYREQEAVKMAALNAPNYYNTDPATQEVVTEEVPVKQPDGSTKIIKVPKSATGQPPSPFGQWYEMGKRPSGGIGGTNPPYSPETIDAYAKQMTAKNTEGQNTWDPSLTTKLMGFGGRNAVNFEKILARAKEIDPSFDMQKMQREYTVSKNVSTQKLQANFDTVQNEIKTLTDLNAKIDRTAFPLLNEGIIKAKSALGNNDTTEWQSAVELFKDSLSTILANGTMTDARLKIAQQALSPYMSEEAFSKVMDNVVSVFVDYRKKAVAGVSGKTATDNTPSEDKKKKLLEALRGMKK